MMTLAGRIPEIVLPFCIGNDKSVRDQLDALRIVVSARIEAGEWIEARLAVLQQGVADFAQRIENPHRLPERMRQARSPLAARHCRDKGILTFRVDDQDRAPPCDEIRNDDRPALARPVCRYGADMAVIAEIQRSISDRRAMRRAAPVPAARDSPIHPAARRNWTCRPVRHAAPPGTSAADGSRGRGRS